MQRHVLGQRTGPAFYLDLRAGFRMGDFACVYLWMLNWREANPTNKLIVLWNPLHWRSVYAKALNMRWIFNGIVDEIWETTKPKEMLPTPPGTTFGNFYKSFHIWNVWKDLRNNRKVQPQLRPNPIDLARAKTLLATHNVPERFFIYTPLVDAGYNKGRNAPIPWWNETASHLADLPMVVLGPPVFNSRMNFPARSYPVWRAAPTPGEVMALASLSALYVGGETGLTLWAALFGAPVVATYRSWVFNDSHDYRPIPFTKPVIWCPLDGTPKAAADIVRRAFAGEITESTP